ncbi:CbtB domain-containing protein [Jongsikchunia kroppenstedtii]|uniref:CbtB domain-containing protein n=1 Tax=Jongsikchunia kroppenstedtii TaxID=1121721 RepID=UPI000361BBAF|nr:CbtB-domain containing protein [Jongsikchunia kroppenstedtii]
MSTNVAASTPGISSEALSGSRVALILTLTVLIAALAYYFIGIDEGMVSMFGKTMVVHEWVHDSRHFLGFPCH